MGKLGKKKKPFPPMGEPHDDSAFMGYMRKHMKKESCECKNGNPKKDDHDDDDKGGDDEPTFLMKKKMAKKMKKESYELPKNIDHHSDTAFMKSMIQQYGDVKERFFDGIHEDALIQPPEPGPGEPGWGPATRIGDAQAQPAIAESIEELSKRIKQLEKQLGEER